MSGDSYINDGSKLPIVEEFYSIQGEGCNTGRAAYFIRVSGCDIGCSWCDTKYAWNADLHPLVEVEKITEHVLLCGADSVVVTGGEPLMWDLSMLCGSLRRHGIETFIETSGAYPLTGTWDWITLSPKKGMSPLSEIWLKADELKVIIEDGTDFEDAEAYSLKVGPQCRLLLQPEWSRYEKMIGVIAEYVKKNTRWAVSLQAHKFMHIP
ncbi:MAG TPA: 7-carboxy-7-deazaguanine synthase QueE [Bacteroidales bacterium]|nr:7-carboxy-7-deazaguanine synthase QueE [Bacteroidales bacterium]